MKEAVEFFEKIYLNEGTFKIVARSESEITIGTRAFHCLVIEDSWLREGRKKFRFCEETNRFAEENGKQPVEIFGIEMVIAGVPFTWSRLTNNDNYDSGSYAYHIGIITRNGKEYEFAKGISERMSFYFMTNNNNYEADGWEASTTIPVLSKDEVALISYDGADGFDLVRS